MARSPEHIGIIPDGNRRWAQSKGLQKKDGYAYGLQAGMRLLRAAKRLAIPELTIYGFTTDNCKRPPEQVAAFSRACEQAAEWIAKENATLRVVGNTHSPCFPQNLLPYAVDNGAPRGDKRMRVNLLVNYGWEWDIKYGLSHAVSRIDMVIRWGGMCRLSGFLPLQTTYADICVLEELWPDFTDAQLEGALAWYAKQDVTLGG